jgi:hypothetical protein
MIKNSKLFIEKSLKIHNFYSTFAFVIHFVVSMKRFHMKSAINVFRTLGKRPRPNTCFSPRVQRFGKSVITAIALYTAQNLFAPMLFSQTAEAYSELRDQSQHFASAPQRPSAQAQNQSIAPNSNHAEELQYVRLSDLTGEGNTQYTYIPASYNVQQLQRHLQTASRLLNVERSTRVDVVVYLNAEGQSTQINYIGEQFGTRNDVAKSACDAVKKCSFTPAYRNNKPVHSVVVIPVKFVF